jgi:hypothetical protein
MREYEILTSEKCSLGEKCGWLEVLSFPRESWKILRDEVDEPSLFGALIGKTNAASVSETSWSV